VADSNLTDLELKRRNDYLVQGNTIQIKAMDFNFLKIGNFSPYRKILFEVLV
jgi:hypothetical protein